ncbi:hypothetical protein [uncultured Pseudoteredinibacter sp.]|uniref:hypothetical protein n=1 Tax=uncultured Pseudoteredinibacter sp. TaxID=1641701 RepID=UPI002632BF58|nr:hypothetical protein [uncultured Pseudoteredinibacter sp.]
MMSQAGYVIFFIGVVLVLAILAIGLPAELAAIIAFAAGFLCAKDNNEEVIGEKLRFQKMFVELEREHLELEQKHEALLEKLD